MFPYKIEMVEENTNKELLAHFEGERTGFCQVGPKKWLLPAVYAEHAEGYYTMPLREDDVWIVTYPRSGTTLCQELIWLINNNSDFNTSAEVSLDKRFPFYEFSLLHHKEFHDEILELNSNDPEVKRVLENVRIPGYKSTMELASPRHIKTHFPFSLLPQKLIETCKVVYVARNPKDVVPSYYHHNKLMRPHGYNGNFQQYWEYFEKDLLVNSPYWDHIKEGWELRNHKNVLFLFYEEIVKDLPYAVQKVAKFLNKTISPDEVKLLANHLQIDNFRKVVPIFKDLSIKGFMKETAEGFVRKGKIGGNNEFTDDLNLKYEAWLKKNLAGTDIVFPK